MYSVECQATFKIERGDKSHVPKLSTFNMISTFLNKKIQPNINKPVTKTLNLRTQFEELKITIKIQTNLKFHKRLHHKYNHSAS